MAENSKLKKILTIVLVSIVFLVFMRNIIVKTVIEQGFSAVVGVQLDIRKLNIGITKTVIHIEDMIFYNPVGFKDRQMVHIPEVYVDYSLLSILRGAIYFNETRFHLKELAVIKNKNGDLNLAALKAPISSGSEKKKEPQKKEKKEKKKSSFRIDLVSFKVDRVLYKDYSGDEVKERVFEVNLDESYKGVDSPVALVSIVVLKTLTMTTISTLANIELKGVPEIVTENIKSVTQTTGEVATKALDKTSDTLKKTGEGVKSLLKKVTGD